MKALKSIISVLITVLITILLFNFSFASIFKAPEVLFNYPAEAKNVRVAYGDMNKDGYLDVVTAYYYGKKIRLRVFLNNSVGEFYEVNIPLENMNVKLKSNYTVYKLFVKDVDRDSLEDIILVVQKGYDFKKRYVYILKNYGNLSFKLLKKYKIKTPSDKFKLDDYGLTVEDIDNDGYVDIVYSLDKYLKNKGDGTFKEEDLDLDLDFIDYDIWSFDFFRLSDIDNDGKIDLILRKVYSNSVTNEELHLYILKNYGNGAFRYFNEVQLNAIGGYLENGIDEFYPKIDDFIFVDLNNDNLKDLIITYKLQTLSFQIYPNWLPPGGLIDPVDKYRSPIGEYRYVVNLYKNTGDGFVLNDTYTYDLLEELNSVITPTSYVKWSLNKTELNSKIRPAYYGGYCCPHYGRPANEGVAGSPSPSIPEIKEIYPKIFVVDIDNDSKKELVSNIYIYKRSIYNPDYVAFGEVIVVFKLNDNLTIERNIHKLFNVPSFPYLVLKDVNNDGLPDIIGLHDFDTTGMIYRNSMDLFVFKNNNGEFWQPDPVSVKSSTAILEPEVLFPYFSEDFDEDGDFDIFGFISFEKIFDIDHYFKAVLLRNDGNGKFKTFDYDEVIYYEEYPTTNAYVTDINSDSHQDIVVKDGDSIYVIVHNLDNFYDEDNKKVNYSKVLVENDRSLLEHSKFTVVDYDKDSYEDILVAKNCGDIYLYKNIGNLSFEKIKLNTPPLEGTHSYKVIFLSHGDFDGDNRPDLILICKTEKKENRNIIPVKKIYVALNKDNYTLDYEKINLEEYSSENNLRKIKDLNNDGFADIVANKYIYINQHDLTFKSIYKVKDYYDILDVVDINNDGRLDLVSVDYSKFKINLSGDNLDFSLNEKTYILPYSSINPILIGNFNNDEYKDIVAFYFPSYNKSATNVQLLENKFGENELYKLTIENSGGGKVVDISGSIDCGDKCVSIFSNGAKVYLKAIPESEDYYFAGWEGDCSSCGYNKECTLIIDSDKTCRANFNAGEIPEVQLETGLLNFEIVKVGEESDDLEVKIKNVGKGKLIINSVELAGNHAEEFEITKDKCSGKTLKKGKKCEIKVVFKPKTEGEKEAYIEITSNALNSPHLIKLTGKAVSNPSGKIEVEPKFIDFGTLGAGVEEEEEKIKVKNVSEFKDAVLVINRVSIPAGNIDQFEIVEDECTGKSLNKGKSCEIKVKFRPTSTGTKYGVLTIGSNDSENPEVIVDLFGTGEGGILSLKGGHYIDFGDVEEGKSEEKKIKLKNTGRGVLEIYSIELIGDEKDYFEVVEDDCSGKSLKRGKSCSVKVRFTPSSELYDSFNCAIAKIKVVSNSDRNPEEEIYPRGCIK